MVDTSVMIEDYKNGYSLAKIQKKYKITPYSFKKILKANGVKVRTREEQNKFNPQNQRQYSVNDNYFDEQTHDSVYLIGFLAADGCVYSNRNLIKIGLSSVDKDFLKEVNRKIGSTFPIRDYTTKNGFPVSELKISSSRIKEKLSEYNIIPKKTSSFTYPKNIKEEFELDFIRGYFDGDGSVSTAGKALRWQICSHTKEILQSIVNILNKHGINKVNIQFHNNLYYIQYSTNATKQIFNLLYYQNCFCLSRKYKKYKTLLMK